MTERQEEKLYGKYSKKKNQKADDIAELAMKGGDISVFFTNKGEMRSPIQRVNVDFTLDMLKELDAIAKYLTRINRN